MVSRNRRLGNIEKLRLVPSFALRQLLQQKDPNRATRYERMSHERMVQEAETIADLTTEDINDIYENYRYSGRVSFYIYLVPENARTLTAEALSQSLEGIEAEEQEEEQTQTVISGIRILDNEVLGNLIELRYKYILTKHYLDENENIQPYSESRFGFVWIDLTNKYLAILSKDERVNAILIDRITVLMGGRPLSVVLPKDLVNRYFNIEDLLSASHFDPATGTKHRISGRGLTNNPENRTLVIERDRIGIRSGSLYNEPVSDDLTSGLGVVAEKGKIYLLKTLSTSILRGWSQQRLPELVGGLRQLQQIGSGEFLQTVRSNFNFSGIGQAGKPLAFSLMERVLSCQKQGVTSIPLATPIEQLLTGLSRFFFLPQLNPYCGQCGNNVEFSCPNCGGQILKPTILGVTCSECNTTWLYHSPIEFRCSEGHTVSVTNIAESLTLLPKESLLNKIYEELNKIETYHFDPGCESFYIHGSTFYYLHQDWSVRFKLEELEGFSTLPALPASNSEDYKSLKKEIRQLKEVCISPGVTREMCTTCVEENGERCCLMKLFHWCVPDYMPTPHHGGEFGDVSFPARLQGRATYFKGLLKSYQPREVSPRDALGKDIISQIVAQDARDRAENVLAVITAARLSPWLETSIEWLVRQYQGRVCIVKEDQLIRIFKKYREGHN